MTSQHNHDQTNQTNQTKGAKTNPPEVESATTDKTTTSESHDALEAARADIADLKASVASLLEHLQSGAKEVKEDLGDGLKEEAGKLSEQMRELFEGFSAGTAKTTVSLEQQVQAQPIRTLAIAVGAGFVLSRLIGSRK
jgi:ElaB/YqjD/DUF883 family membrane-anchored ribosome-binding protein